PGPLGARAGFGVIEEAVFGDGADVASARERSTRATRSMIASLRTLRASTGLLTIGDTSALDAMRLELARVMTTGVEGYDSDESGAAIAESAAALDGIRDGLVVLAARGGGEARASAIALVESAAKSLRETPDFAAFDRFAFISRNGSSAARSLLALRHAIDP